MKPGRHLNILQPEGQGGVSLVEVVVAACLLILSLTALLVLFSRTSQSAEAAKRQINALQIARAELEQFRATTYSNITTYAAVPLTNGYFAALGGKKQCTVVETNNYKEIALSISWQSSANVRFVTQTINTIICNTN